MTGYFLINGWGVLKGAASARTEINSRIAVQYQERAVKPAEILPKLIYNPQESREVNELFTNLNNYLLSTTAAFLSGGQDINSYWNTYISELNTIGVQRMLSLVQGVYNRMYN